MPNQHTKRPVSLQERFWAKVDQQAIGCWLWIGARTDGGYGTIDSGGRTVAAHRVSYELAKGQIPSDLQIDHRCRVRHCVNPAHLELVLRKTNILRGVSFSAVNARKTHCPSGHEYTEDNLYRRANGSRDCKACDARADEGWKEND